MKNHIAAQIFTAHRAMAAMRADFVRAGQKIQTGDLVPGRILCGLVERVNYKALK